MEHKRKAIPNRTIGLQTKIINDAVKEDKCEKCNGTGKYNIYIPSSSFRNLKSQSSNVCLENDCTCDNGIVRTKIRVIRKNRVAAII